jgi:Spy/CpxP family protein refolding chaperone
MNKYLFILVALIISLGQSYAQSTDPTPMDGEVKELDFTKDLGLTPDQKAKMKKINDDRKAAIKEEKMKMRTQRNEIMEQRKAEREKRMANYDQQVKDILTPEQYDKYNKKKAEAKEKVKAKAKEKKHKSKGKMKGKKDEENSNGDLGQK